MLNESFYGARTLLGSGDASVRKVDDGSKNNDDTDYHGYKATLIVLKTYHY